MSELLALLIWLGLAIHVLAWVGPWGKTSGRTALFSSDARGWVVNAQRDLMAGRTNEAAAALNRLTDEIDHYLNELLEAQYEAELGRAADAICRIEALLHPGRAVQ